MALEIKDWDKLIAILESNAESIVPQLGLWISLSAVAISLVSLFVAVSAIRRGVTEYEGQFLSECEDKYVELGSQLSDFGEWAKQPERAEVFEKFSTEFDPQWLSMLEFMREEDKEYLKREIWDKKARPIKKFYKKILRMHALGAIGDKALTAALSNFGTDLLIERVWPLDCFVFYYGRRNESHKINAENFNNDMRWYRLVQGTQRRS